MNRFCHLRIWLLLLAASCGCHHRCRQHSDCSRINTCQASAAAAILETTDCPAGVGASFEALQISSEDFDSNLDAMYTGATLNIALHECCCVAALHSPIANLVDKQRKAICCATGCVECVDRFLAGQSTEQRNKSAGDAGELFLRLVEVSLQRQLLDEAFQKVTELESTVRVADENGLATENYDAELKSRTIELNKKLAEIDSAELKLTVKLNLILGVDSCNPRPIQPCFDLFPQPEPLDIDQLVIQALTQRPELSAMRQFGQCPDDEDCLSLISKIEPRLGIGLPAGPVGCLQRIFSNRASGLSCCTRQKQFMELRETREEMVRQQVIDAAIDIQTAYQQLKLETEDLSRLERRRQTIEAAEVLDAQSSFIDSLDNWADQHAAKSQRISTAIKFEVAKVRLREATGQWIQECGLSSTDAVCSKCR